MNTSHRAGAHLRHGAGRAPALGTAALPGSISHPSHTAALEMSTNVHVHHKNIYYSVLFQWTQHLPKQGSPQCPEEPDRTPPGQSKYFPFHPSAHRVTVGSAHQPGNPEAAAVNLLLALPGNCDPASVASPCPDFLQDWCFLQLPG